MYTLVRLHKWVDSNEGDRLLRLSVSFFLRLRSSRNYLEQFEFQIITCHFFDFIKYTSMPVGAGYLNFFTKSKAVSRDKRNLSLLYPNCIQRTRMLFIPFMPFSLLEKRMQYIWSFSNQMCIDFLEIVKIRGIHRNAISVKCQTTFVRFKMLDLILLYLD